VTLQTGIATPNQCSRPCRTHGLAELAKISQQKMASRPMPYVANNAEKHGKNGNKGRV